MNTVKAFLCTVAACGLKKFNSDQYKQIYSSFKWYDLTLCEVKVYAKSNISNERMRLCKHTLDKGFPVEYLDELLNMDLPAYKLRNAIDGYFAGIPKERIKEYIVPDLKYEESYAKYMELRKKFEKD